MGTYFFPLEENLTLWLGQRNIKDFLFKVRFLKEKPHQKPELWRTWTLPSSLWKIISNSGWVREISK
jgi:hypothetical protein